MKELSLREIQLVETGILKEFISICEKNSFKYYLYYGSLLGAVRHKGFIPWDDDIDISMPRADYERFLKIASKQLKEGYTLQHYRVDKNTPTYQAKVRKDNTLFVENYLNKLNTHKGIFVDIFPYDKVPEDEKQRSVYEKKCWRLRRIFVSKDVVETTTERNKYKKVIYGTARKVMHTCLKAVPKEKLFNDLDVQYRKYNNSNTNIIECCANVPLKKTDIFPLRKAQFEELTVNIPNDADKVLRAEYGNYMELPPEQDCIGHAPDILVFDVNGRS